MKTDSRMNKIKIKIAEEVAERVKTKGEEKETRSWLRFSHRRHK